MGKRACDVVVVGVVCWKGVLYVAVGSPVVASEYWLNLGSGD